jgi:hypothetical protein
MAGSVSGDSIKRNGSVSGLECELCHNELSALFDLNIPTNTLGPPGSEWYGSIFRTIKEDVVSRAMDS